MTNDNQTEHCTWTLQEDGRYRTSCTKPDWLWRYTSSEIEMLNAWLDGCPFCSRRIEVTK